MEIIIENRSFAYDISCRLIKTKYAECPFNELSEIWDDIEPISFKDIAKNIENIEGRRIAINCLGINNLIKEVNPKLLCENTIQKETVWVGEDGKLIENKFSDTYKLYEVEAEKLGIETKSIWGAGQNFFHYVACKDTSTDREYLLWVDAASVYIANSDDTIWTSSQINYGSKINAIQAIAWTIQTDINVGGIEKIVRQGDCILIKVNDDAIESGVRHLSEKEYRELLVAES